MRRAARTDRPVLLYITPTARPTAVGRSHFAHARFRTLPNANAEPQVVRSSVVFERAATVAVHSTRRRYRVMVTNHASFWTAAKSWSPIARFLKSGPPRATAVARAILALGSESRAHAHARL
jgi:hypothetical protein